MVKHGRSGQPEQSMHRSASQTPHPIAISLGDAFARAGFDLYEVGGSVRDRLLGSVVSDYDFATNAQPDDTRSVLQSLAEGSAFSVGDKFGTIGYRVNDFDAEITTYRGEQYVDDSRHPQVTFSATLAEDLARRDFTVNAMALPAAGGDLIDPFDGQSDLRNSLLRGVDDPEERFREDPLRMLRAARLASKLRFEIEPTTVAAMSAQADRVKILSAERLFDESTKLLMTEHVSAGMNVLLQTEVLVRYLPEVADLAKITDPGPHHKLDVWTHTLNVVAGVQPRPEVRWAALLHDLGKYSTQSLEPDGRMRFFGHEAVSAKLSDDIMVRLRASNRFRQTVTTLVANHMRPHAYGETWTDGAVRRLERDSDGHFDWLIDLAVADARATNDDERSKYSRLRSRAEQLHIQVPKPSSPLSGSELSEGLGREPGAWIKPIKEQLTELVIDGVLAPDDKAAAWRIVKERFSEP